MSRKNGCEVVPVKLKSQFEPRTYVMKKRKNDLNHEAFEEARRRLEKSFPYGGIKKGFYIKGLKEAGILGSRIKVAVSAVVNVVGDKLHLRTYRLPKESGSGIRYKVDEVRGVNREVVELLAGHEVPDHHITHDVPEDMMRQNNLTIEMVPDGDGGLTPNVKEDGLVQAYINIPDPEEALRKSIEERSQKAKKEAFASAPEKPPETDNPQAS